MSTTTSTDAGLRVVTFTIDRSSGEPRIPDPAPPREKLKIWYGYDRKMPPTNPAEKPHELELRVVGLEPEETLEIHLVGVKHVADEKLAERLRTEIFPTAAPASHGFGWAIPYGSGPVRTGPAWSEVGKIREFEIEYKARLYDREGLKAQLDPDIQLLPDP